MPTNQQLKRILVTAGEPAGIGPDLCLQLAGPQTDCEIVVIADQQLLQERASQLGLSIDITAIDPQQPPSATAQQQLKVWHTPLVADCVSGSLNISNATYVLKTLDLACDACLAGQAHAMVTAPVHKAVINDAGIAFSGHTEYLQQRCQSNQVVMMLACAAMRVALVTTHLPLSKVSAAITPERLKQVVKVLQAELQQRFATQAQEKELLWLAEAMELANSCELHYKNVQNKRLHVELCLMQIASLHFNGEKKKEK